MRQGSSSVPASAERIKAMIVETNGTGLMKIADSYKNSTVKHKLEVTEQAFKITLPFRPKVMNGFNKKQDGRSCGHIAFYRE